MKKIGLLFLGLFCFIQTVSAEEINSAFFLDLEISNGTMSPAFDRNITEYSVLIPEDEISISIDYELEDSYATLIIIGNDYLNLGLNEVTLRVISSDDEQVINYKFLVTKSDSIYTFDEDSTAVALEIPVKTEITKYNNTAQIISAICFITLLFVYWLLFGRKNKRINNA